ncbi:PAAR domain-containing protein [Citrobacter sp. JGM124]|uniref:PAAR domain-containing protein n=1 Tax=Citrobacter sp. JGM124 TaxID=2799789 RepID=UPI001BA58D5E|nr:PAAR domain-containing protein [Citrobacter sp. JGM124]MBS0849866.1 PAAR domain-containing protein [Citrobacter sp. JGM124]
MKQYTNELTPSVLALFKEPFSAEQLSGADEEQRQIFKSHAEEMKDRSLVAIWRFATAGSLTRNGGKIEKASASDSFTLEDGSEVNRAMVGDYVVYPDGTRARIINGSGSANTNGSGVSFALVGSQLDNGDVIVSTPQDCALLCQPGNSPAMPADFLAPVAL